MYSEAVRCMLRSRLELQKGNSGSNTMSSPDKKLVAFLPWLKLSSSVSVGKVSYVPFETGEMGQDEPLKGLANSLTKILSSYVGFLDRSVAAYTVVLKADRNPAWSLEKQISKRFNGPHRSCSWQPPHTTTTFNNCCPIMLTERCSIFTGKGSRNLLILYP